MDVYRQLQDFVHIAMVPRYYELISWRSSLTDLAGLPFLEIAQPHLSAWDTFMKRAFDICISSAVLLLTSPLLVAVAIGVKMSSPGPVFFRQVRLGRDTEPFMVTKFRTMTMDADVVPACPSEPEDPDRPLHELRNKKDESARITPFGAFLRRSGIDEIPQFISVFKGTCPSSDHGPSFRASPTSRDGRRGASRCGRASRACGRSRAETT